MVQAQPIPEPSKQDLSPVVPAGREKEPIMLLDTSGSMAWPAADGSNIQRRQVAGEAMGQLVTALGAQDSQAEAEAAAGEDAGGLMVVRFAGDASVLEDFSAANYQRKWADIEWGGGTIIMPGWALVVDNYLEEFGKDPENERPALLVLVVTDGEAEDIAAFEAECAKVAGNTYICVAILGYGEEHDRTLADYQRIAAANDHVRVVSFGSETDPKVISDGLISLMS